MTQKHIICTDFHWIGETLMAKEFGESIELCNVDWSGLDEYEVEHKRLIAAAPELLRALEMAQLWLDVDGRFNMQIINAAIAKAKGETQ